MIDCLAQLPTGPRVSRSDIVEVMGEAVRQLDPAVHFRHGFKRKLTNRILKAADLGNLDRVLRQMPKRYADPFNWLRTDDETLLLPVGLEQLAMFAMLFSSDGGRELRPSTMTLPVVVAVVGAD